MPATPSSTPPPPPSPPPTSPQLHQQASHYQEHNQRVMGSPEQHRVPATSSYSTSTHQPSIFNGQVFCYLPAHLAAQLAALPPIPQNSRHSTLAPFVQNLNPAQLAAANATTISQFNSIHPNSVSLPELLIISANTEHVSLTTRLYPLLLSLLLSLL